MVYKKVEHDKRTDRRENNPRRAYARKLKSEGNSYYSVGVIMGISQQRAQQLISPTPKERRDIILSKNGICDRCGLTPMSPHIHHLDYSEHPQFELLCPKCHAETEQRIRRGPNYIPVKRNVPNTYGYRGLSFNKPIGMWCARIMVNRVQHVSKYFSTPEEAAREYDKLAKLYLGEKSMSILNFPDNQEAS